MDFNEIKQFSPNNGERIILVENGKPTVVLLSFEEYKKISRCDAKVNNEAKKMPLKVQPQISSQTEQMQEVSQSRQESCGDLTLDDLPF